MDGKGMGLRLVVFRDGEESDLVFGAKEQRGDVLIGPRQLRQLDIVGGPELCVWLVSPPQSCACGLFGRLKVVHFASFAGSKFGM